MLVKSYSNALHLLYQTSISPLTNCAVWCKCMGEEALCSAPSLWSNLTHMLKTNAFQWKLILNFYCTLLWAFDLNVIELFYSASILYWNLNFEYINPSIDLSFCRLIYYVSINPIYYVMSVLLCSIMNPLCYESYNPIANNKFNCKINLRSEANSGFTRWHAAAQSKHKAWLETLNNP